METSSKIEQDFAKKDMFFVKPPFTFQKDWAIIVWSNFA